MKFLTNLFGTAEKGHHALLYLPAFIALILVVYGVYFVEEQNAQLNIQEQRNEVRHQIDQIRTDFQKTVNSSIQLSQGMVAAIAVEPAMEQSHFTDLSTELFKNQNIVKNIAAAPGLMVSMIFPKTGNESVLGHDYRTNPTQVISAEHARDSHTAVFDGPIKLAQEGTGFVVRIPVYLDGSDDAPYFWGLVSTVIDAQVLFEQSGLLGNNTLNLEFTKNDPAKEGLEPILATSTEQLDKPVSVTVALLNSSFTLSAEPIEGWDNGPTNLWRNRALSFLAGALVIFPIFVAGWLIGERRKNMQHLQKSAKNLALVSNRLELALSTSQIGVWEFDSATESLIWDERMCELYDVPKEEKPEYSHWVDRIHPDDLEQAKLEFSLALLEQQVYHSQFRVMRQDGTITVIRTIGSTTLGDDGFVKIVGINWDITDEVLKNEQLEIAKDLSEARNAELEEAKVRIEHNSLHDSLTNLPNRRYLDEVLSGQHENRYGMVKNYSLLHIDLDRFKQINDTLGHAAGDKTLVHAANILSRNVRASDFVARVGGDEFVILCTSRLDKQILHKLAARINEEMKRPIVIDGRESRCGVSIGIASYDSVNGNPEQLLSNADMALYHAKNRGRNTYRFFTKKMHQAAVNTKCVADEILAGIEQNQFIVHYQGQFDANTLEISGVEALARWQHPVHGLMSPDSFIEIAEELSVMATIDAQILNQSLDQMAKWKKAGVKIPQVSVNISARRLADEKLIEGLMKLDIEPGTLTFEFLETILLENTSDQVAWNIDQIRDLGIDIELDDFGTGYASIVSLMQLRPKMLKIDRQLVMPITESLAQRELVQSIVNIGSALGIGAVAEGVETMEHAKIMRELGCKTLQGFGLARPMDGDAFTQFVRETTKNPLLVA